MKKLVAILMITVLLAGCTSSTAFGPCIGAFDDKDPAKVYKLDAWNTFLAIFFSATIFVPVVVVVNETFCPVGNKTPPAVKQ